MADDTVTIGRRVVGFADYGPRDGVPVLWCHGGPGSRLEPAPLVDAATDAGLRLIGIDRPGYGMSTPMPGRTIVGWVSDALAVAGVLEIEHFAAAGDSTGGAYALALAVRAPERVLGVLACCAATSSRLRSVSSAPPATSRSTTTTATRTRRTGWRSACSRAPRRTAGVEGSRGRRRG